MTCYINDKHRILLMLSSIRENIDNIKGQIEEKYVIGYHVALDRLEAMGLDTAEFRIPGSEIRPKATSLPNSTFQGQRSKPPFSSEKYVDKLLLLTKLDSAIKYFGAS